VNLAQRTKLNPAMIFRRKGAAVRAGPFQICGIGFVTGFVVFAEGFVGGFEHGGDAVPFVFGVVQVELLGAARAFVIHQRQGAAFVR
jgi:hypothetical protein